MMVITIAARKERNPLKTKEQLIKSLKKYPADDIKIIYEIISRVLLANEDFRIAKYAISDDIRPIIEEETKEKIDFPMDTVIQEASLNVFSQFEDNEYSGRRLKKQERMELIADVMLDETLFEGFCLCLDESDETLLHFCEDLDCGDIYVRLSEDPVYKKRKEYMRLIAEYSKAAVNLYGVIHLVELENIIRDYEKNFRKRDGFSRNAGSYANTIVFDPRYMGVVVLRTIVDNMIPSIGVTMDGLAVHQCFFAELEQERGEWLKRLTEDKYMGKEPDLDDALDSLGYYSYRELYHVAMPKPMYVPDKAEFLKYTDDLYYENTEEMKKLRRYLKANFGRAFKKKGLTMGMSEEGCIDNFIEILYEEVSDYGIGLEETTDPNEYIQFVFDLLHAHGIDMKDMKQTNELLSLVMNMRNSIRLWVNHGYSPTELVRINPVRPQNMTVVPGSSVAAKMLKETQQELEKMGIHTDLEATATTIPTISFPEGVGGKANAGERKVYPNDPCPCGSGKKFKKCCGKNR